MPTGLIYTNYLLWQNGCYGNIGCATSAVGNVDITDPLFLLLTGQYAQMFSSLLSVFVVSASTLSFTIPWIQFTTWIIGLPSFYVPSVQATSVSWGGFPLGAFGLYVPLITIPWIGFSSYYLQLGQLNLPWIGASSWAIPFPAFTTTALVTVLGIIMIVLGLGITFNVWVFGIGSNEQGAYTLTVIGSAILLWTFIQAFTGSWLLSLSYGWGTIIMQMLELLFIIGVYGELTKGAGG